MEENKQVLPREEQIDIFLCTRELPDKLTAETAALRQLCAALVGEGYSVFFPSALPGELTDEQRAQRIVDALKSSRVMVAAGVGPEGLTDLLSRGLWGAFLKSGEDADRRFFLCWRDQGDAALPVILEGRPMYDMSDLSFLTELKAALAAVLPPPRAMEPEEGEETSPEPEDVPVKEEVPVAEAAPAEDIPAEEPPAEDTTAEEPPAEAPVEEAPAEEPSAEDTTAEEPPVEPEKKPFPWKWLLLGAAVIALIVWLLLRK